jgi:hypothetical protein
MGPAAGIFARVIGKSRIDRPAAAALPGTGGGGHAAGERAIGRVGAGADAGCTSIVFPRHPVLGVRSESDGERHLLDRFGHGWEKSLLG